MCSVPQAPGAASSRLARRTSSVVRMHASGAVVRMHASGAVVRMHAFGEMAIQPCGPRAGRGGNSGMASLGGLAGSGPGLTHAAEFR